jgi:hypothetical protein
MVMSAVLLNGARCCEPGGAAGLANKHRHGARAKRFIEAGRQAFFRVMHVLAVEAGSEHADPGDLIDGQTVAGGRHPS